MIYSLSQDLSNHNPEYQNLKFRLPPAQLSFLTSICQFDCHKIANTCHSEDTYRLFNLRIYAFMRGTLNLWQKSVGLRFCHVLIGTGYVAMFQEFSFYCHIYQFAERDYQRMVLWVQARSCIGLVDIWRLVFKKFCLLAIKTPDSIDPTMAGEILHADMFQATISISEI